MGEINALLQQVVSLMNCRDGAARVLGTEEALGVAIAEFFEWDDRIVDCMQHALEDANFHQLNKIIDDWREDS